MSLWGCSSLTGRAASDLGAEAATDAAVDGAFEDADVAACTSLARVSSGERDPQFLGGTFPAPGGFMIARGASFDRRGRVLIYGSRSGCSGASRGDFAVVRHGLDGAVDRTFGVDGSVCVNGPRGGSSDDHPYACAVDPVGRIYLAGAADGVASVLRLTAEGRPDPSFGVMGWAELYPAWGGGGAFRALGIEADISGAIVAGEADAVGFVARLDLRGALDTSFEATEGAWDDTVLGWTALRRVGGSLLTVGTRGRDSALVLRRVTIDGAIDATFGERGYAVALADQFARPRAIVAHRDGAITVAASSRSDDVSVAFATLARFTPSGALDERFATRGVYTSTWNLNAEYDFTVLATDCEDRALLCATERRSPASAVVHLDRVDARGRLDRAFAMSPGATGDERTHGALAVLVDPATQWIHFATRSGLQTSYAIYRVAP